MAMADPMQVLSVSTAFGLWDQMMGVALAVGDDPVAQRANQARLNNHMLFLLK
jgi:hypothetical protein